jgi:hypothetical protein
MKWVIKVLDMPCINVMMKKSVLIMILWLLIVWRKVCFIKIYNQEAIASMYILILRYRTGNQKKIITKTTKVCSLVLISS